MRGDDAAMIIIAVVSIVNLIIAAYHVLTIGSITELDELCLMNSFVCISVAGLAEMIKK